MGQIPFQVRDKILELIQAQRFTEGRLPAEAALAHDLGVSRNTLRDALALLERDGVVVRRHGLGTFLRAARPQIRMPLTEFGSIPEDFTRVGLRPGVRDVKTGAQTGPSDAHDLLGRPNSEALFTLSRLYLADDQPAIFTINYFPAGLGLANRAWDDFDGDLHKLLRSVLGIEVQEMRMRLRATVATREVAAELGIARGAPVLQMSHQLYGPEARLITCSESYQNTDIIEVTAIARRGSHPADKERS
jgi:GntR family transcriptional regulator